MTIHCIRRVKWKNVYKQLRVVLLEHVFEILLIKEESNTKIHDTHMHMYITAVMHAHN